VKKFATQHGVGLSTLSKWLQQERRGGDPAMSFQEVVVPTATLLVVAGSFLLPARQSRQLSGLSTEATTGVPFSRWRTFIDRRQCVTANIQLFQNAYMKTQRIIGVLWMIFNGVLGMIYLWLLLYPVIRFSRVPSSSGYYLGALFCPLYWAGAVAGFTLFRGAQGARKFVVLVAFLIVIATIAGFVALRSLPGTYYIVSVLAAVSAAFLFLPRHNTVA
jgi:hypothetical protein